MRLRHATLTLAAAGLLLGGAACEAEGEATCDDPSTICTWAGDGQPGFDGDGNTLLKSSFYWPIDVTFTPGGDAYIVDWNNHRIRKVTDAGSLETVIGTDFIGDGPKDQSDLTPPGAPGTSIDLNHPTQLVPLPTGRLLLVSWHNHKLREWDPETGLAVVTCGGPPGYGGDGGDAHKAKMDQPTQVRLAPDGTMYILDMRNQVVRRISPDGIIETVAGTVNVTGYTGDGGDPLQATFTFPDGSNPPPGGALALDLDGRLYVSDTLNHAIRRIDFDAGTIETVAGTGVAGFDGDGPGAEHQLNNPRDLERGPDGRIYIADELNHRVRALDPDTGELVTIAGNGTAGFSGDGGPPIEASLNRPGGLAFDNDGLLYVVDTYNHRIRRFEVTP